MQESISLSIENSNIPNIRSKPLPPMLEQYLDFKSKYSDALILFQVGDFYEVFFDDAITVAGALNLTLTSRDKNDPNPIPMCGVPISVIDGYLDRLVNAGYSVAIVSQVGEVPAKGMVKRELERIVTPGLRILSSTQDKIAILAALYFQTDSLGAISFLDIEKGIINVKEGITFEEALSYTAKQNTTESIIYNQINGVAVDRRNNKVKQLEFLTKSPVKFRGEAINIQAATTQEIEGFNNLTPTGKKSVQLLINYVLETTITIDKTVKKVQLLKEDNLVYIDPTTRSNLELVQTLRDGTKKGTLFDVIDETKTLGGQKLLRQWILSPLKDVNEIQKRHDLVEAFIKTSQKRERLQEILKYAPDIERIATRISIEVAGPKEFATIRDFLIYTEELVEILSDINLNNKQNSNDLVLLSGVLKNLKISPEIFTKLFAFIHDSPPRKASEGGIVKDGYNEELDRLRRLKNSGKSWITELESKERQRTGISSLKIKYHRIIGYYIEISNSNIDKVPSDYVRRQSTATGERYVLPHLKDMESEVLSAESKQNLLEERLFLDFRKDFLKYTDQLKIFAEALAVVDILLGFATVSEKERYTRPIVDDSTEFRIKNGKHPVLAKILNQKFVPNSISFYESNSSNINDTEDPEQTRPFSFILTGPNMGGKSTFLRQNALIAIMAQVGCFVPADEALIGVVDRIFARIGASDNLLEGESTFMVEMKEASHILSNATERSLVLIDEIGRGTSTKDGEAIATAIFAWLLEITKSRNLFATHFKDLSLRFKSNPAVCDLSVGSSKVDGEIVFTHEIHKGVANESYGIEVARMAGLPPALIEKAKSLLQETPNSTKITLNNIKKIDKKDSQLAFNLFDANLINNDVSLNKTKEVGLKSKKEILQESKVVEKLNSLSINCITPIEALNILSSLQNEIKQELE